ncbi:Cryptochrome-1 [Venturia nashicola]|nr:Cryptochrome-1 [Venturia nashicola]
MIHGKAAAGLQMDYEDETEREKQVTMTHEIGTSSDISEFRLDYGDLEIEDLGKMAFQEHFLRAWTPKTSEEEALVHSPAATATYGSVLLHPIVRENTEGPAPSATTSGHPIDQPGLVSTFGGPAEAQRFFRRRYGGGYPASYSQDRDETPRPTFPKRIIWSKNEAAVHAPNLPPSQASHSRQPTVTEEAEVEVIPVSRVSETTDVARNIEVACHRANMARLQPGRVELDRMSTLDPRAPLQHGGLGMGRGRRDSRPSSYNRRVKGTNQDPVADRWTQRFGPTLANERGNTDFGGSTGNLSSGDVFASGALQPRENEADSQSVAADHRRSMRRCSFMSGMNMKRNGSIDEGVGEAMNFFD